MTGKNELSFTSPPNVNQREKLVKQLALEDKAEAAAALRAQALALAICITAAEQLAQAGAAEVAELRRRQADLKARTKDALSVSRGLKFVVVIVNATNDFASSALPLAPSDHPPNGDLRIDEEKQEEALSTVEGCDAYEGALKELEAVQTDSLLAAKAPRTTRSTTTVKATPAAKVAWNSSTRTPTSAASAKSSVTASGRQKRSDATVAARAAHELNGLAVSQAEFRRRLAAVAPPVASKASSKTGRKAVAFK